MDASFIVPKVFGNEVTGQDENGLNLTARGEDKLDVVES